MIKQSYQEVEDDEIWEKHSDTGEVLMIELIEMVKKTTL